MSEEQPTKKSKTGESKEKSSKAERESKKEKTKVEIILKSQEKTGFKISREAALQSNLLKTALEDDRDAKEVPLVHISAPIVRLVIQYMEYHEKKAPRKVESPIKTNNMKELVDRFDAAFVDDLDVDTLMRLLLAANYMDIKSLLDLLCVKVATMMKDRTAPQIRKAFNIREEFTPEEYDEIKEKFSDLLPIDDQKSDKHDHKTEQKSNPKQ